jgi:hypothetical protein
VLNDSRRQLRAIAGWLGIRNDEDAIEAMLHPEESPFSRPGVETGCVAGGNDPNFLKDPVPRRAEVPQTVEAPTGWDAEPRVWDMVARLAKHLGYG